MRLIFTILSYVCFGGIALAQPIDKKPADKAGNDVALSELRAAPIPKQVSNLDTLQLASAHRDRAASVDEKTNGLWQSWTTSICEGCGNTPPYHDTVRNDFANRKGPAGLKAKAGLGEQQQTVRQKALPEPSQRSLDTDLSNESIDQIRRMPGR